MPSQLLWSKLYRPRVSTELVRRPRLLNQLTSGLSQGIILVSAPAGFGKSMLLANWLEGISMPSGWLTLDGDDNDIRLFSQYLVAAIQTVFPGGLQSSFDLVHGNIRFDSLRIARTLAADVAELPTDFCLVLDDFHTIRNTEVNAVMSQLIRHLPPQMHLAIASRTDSPLPLARLRASGQLCELRGRDLRFTNDEAELFLHQSTHTELDPEAVRQLQKHLEGWAVGLRFASILLREGTSSSLIAEQLAAGTNRSVMNYLLEEVLAQLEPQVRDFVLKSALV